MRVLNFAQIVGSQKLESTMVYPGIDPATVETLWEAPVATQDDLDNAVKAANHAFKHWSGLPHGERCRLVGQFADGLEKYKDALPCFKRRPARRYRRIQSIHIIDETNRLNRENLQNQR